MGLLDVLFFFVFFLLRILKILNFYILLLNDVYINYYDFFFKEGKEMFLL